MGKLDKNRPIFVYGTLLSGFHNYCQYIFPYHHQVKEAKIRGSLYHLPSRGYPAVIAGEGWVQGELICFDDDVFLQVLTELDELETFFAPNDNRNEYERETVEAVMVDSGEVVWAYVYVMRGAQEKQVRQTGILLPSGNWRCFIQRGTP